MSARELPVDGVRGAAARVKRWTASSAWAPLAGKAAAYALAFVLLALVGSGRLSRWLTPPPRLGIGVAEAATATPPPRASALSEAPSATQAAEAPEAPSATPVAAVASEGADAGAAPQDPAGASKGIASDGKIILNLAVEEDLRKLPGIGRTKAQAILALRAQMKKFTRVEDLLKVKGIGRRALARLRPLVRVD